MKYQYQTLSGTQMRRRHLRRPRRFEGAGTLPDTDRIWNRLYAVMERLDRVATVMQWVVIAAALVWMVCGFIPR